MSLQDPRIFKDSEDAVANQLADQMMRHMQGVKTYIIQLGKRFEQTGTDSHNVCGQICHEARRRHATDDQIDYIIQICGPLDWTRNYDMSNRIPSKLGLEIRSLPDLDNKISDKELDELLKLRSDAMHEIAHYDLSFDQMGKLSQTEKQDYRDARAKVFSQQKTHIDHGKKNFEEKMALLGLWSKEEKDKKSTLVPPKELWGYSDTYKYFVGLSQQHDTIGKYLADVARQVYMFKLEKKLDKEALAYCKSYHDKRLIPLMQVALIAGTEVTNILENIQDEKNRDSALGWMVKGMHKHLDYGNHGTGEVDFIQTGEYIFRLGKENNVVIKVPIKRETTREQVGDKTTVRILDKSNQMHIHCPNSFSNIECKECGSNEFVVNAFDKDDKPVKLPWDKKCGLDFNKPIIGDEERDLFAGDLFYKAVQILQANDLSNAIEAICDNVLIREIQTPEEFYKKEMKKQGKTLEVTSKEQIKVMESKPEKIKEVKIDESSKSTVAYNIFYGRAHRTQLKSQHFSEQA